MTCIPGIEVIGFDFDGTLADTTSAILATALQTLEDLSLAAVPEALFLSMIGLPLKQAFLGAGVPPEAADACVVRYRERFPDNLGRVSLFPGVRACLDQLARQGVSMGIVSSRGRKSLLELLDLLKIDAYFRAVLGDEDVVGKKPAPDLVLELCARLGGRPESVLVVGDTTYDIEMGRAAGARTCAVTYGSHDAARLRQAQPTHQLDSLSGLGALLAR